MKNIGIGHNGPVWTVSEDVPRVYPIPVWKCDWANASLNYQNRYKKNIPTLVY